MFSVTIPGFVCRVGLGCWIGEVSYRGRKTLNLLSIADFVDVGKLTSCDPWSFLLSILRRTLYVAMLLHESVSL